MVQLVDCPDCLERVLPRADGRCPACGADTRNRQAVRVKATLAEGGRVPGVCHGCGANTSSHVVVSRDRHSHGHWALFAASVLAFAIAALTHTMPAALSGMVGVTLLIAGARQRAREGLRTVVVRLPTCDACQRNGTPEPTHVDFAQSAMTFVVHREFRRGLD